MGSRQEGASRRFVSGALARLAASVLGAALLRRWCAACLDFVPRTPEH